MTLTSPGFPGAVVGLLPQPDFLGEPHNQYTVNIHTVEQNHCKSNTPGRKKGPDLLTAGLEEAEGTFPEAKAGSCPESREAGTRGLRVPGEGLTEVSSFSGNQQHQEGNGSKRSKSLPLWTCQSYLFGRKGTVYSKCLSSVNP